MWALFVLGVVVDRDRMAYFVYILQSQLDGSYYVGSTQDVTNRLAAHNSGRGRYTRKKMPWKVVFELECASKRDALILEKRIKQQKSRKFIESLIHGELLL